DALERLLTKVDQRFLQKRRFGREALDTHAKNLADSRKLFHGGAPRLISLPLTEEERAFWSEGVPDHYTERSKANIWEQMAYAFKILSNDLTRTVALEFDYIDEHNPREESLLRTEAKQAAIPLARMIAKLKEAGIYDRTLIAVYTTDGSRTPEAQSTGDRGKNTLILAGGMVRGGYFGDLRVAGDMETGHSYSYHAPDPVTGAPGPGSTDNDRRASAAAGWRTVVKALGIPDSVAEQFPSVANARPLPFLLRT
ncbi:MAG TPA: DUF1501 domain-containing protein, partial [Myxococcaceae bacterium]|nr:DUF1501 domain-containing protein [Myxococcaceae bacterium]